MRMPNDDEAFPTLQYSKGFGRCSKCKLVRPFKHLVLVDGACLCRDAEDCTRMKRLKEQATPAPPAPPGGRALSSE